MLPLYQKESQAPGKFQGLNFIPYHQKESRGKRQDKSLAEQSRPDSTGVSGEHLTKRKTETVDPNNRSQLVQLQPDQKSPQRFGLKQHPNKTDENRSS
jgi:hypothetical protein